MPHRLRLLLVARSLPEPAQDGYRIRVRHLIAGLARRHDVVLLASAASDDASTAQSALRELGVQSRLVPPASRPSGFARLRHEISFQPSLMRRTATAYLEAAAGELLREQRFDLAQLEGSEFASLRLPAPLPVVIDEHNIWSELIARRTRLRRPGPGRLPGMIEAQRIRRAEEKAWRNAAGVVFTSDREAAVARRRVPRAHVGVVPNGVDIDFFDPRHAVAAARDLPVLGADSLVFIGLLSYTANVDAAIWFATKILPLIRARRPGASFTVVGRDADRRLSAISDRAQVIGPVTDVRPYLAAASVVVVPLRAGSGTRLKILEAMAMGKPVVTTSIGCEGLNVRSGEHLVIAEDPQSIAFATVDLLADDRKRAQVGLRAREFVVRNHAWAAVVDRLEAFHAQILASRAT